MIKEFIGKALGKLPADFSLQLLDSCRRGAEFRATRRIATTHVADLVHRTPESSLEHTV